MKFMDMMTRKKEQEKDTELRRQQMAMQVSENAKDREQRGAERKETSAYNRGMLELYRGDRASAEMRRLQEAEDKANQEYLLAYMKQDEAGMVLAEKKIEQLRKKQAAAAAQPQREQAPPPAIGTPLTSRGLF
jgi:hypothetical protein